MSMGLQSNDKESSPRAESPTEAGVWMRSLLFRVLPQLFDFILPKAQ